jgi:hypothetical protein
MILDAYFIFSGSIQSLQYECPLIIGCEAESSLPTFLWVFWTKCPVICKLARMVYTARHEDANKKRKNQSSKSPKFSNFRSVCSFPFSFLRFIEYKNDKWR